MMLSKNMAFGLLEDDFTEYRYGFEGRVDFISFQIYEFRYFN